MVRFVYEEVWALMRHLILDCEVTLAGNGACRNDDLHALENLVDLFRGPR